MTSIFIIITGLILANNSRFGGKILLENLAYDIALSVRQAQVYGISVRQYGAGNFEVGYGLHFAKGTTYVLFADATKDGIFEPDQSETVESTDIERGYFIAQLCAPAQVDVATCIAGAGAVSSLDILFKRPEPDACISKEGVSAISGNYACTAGQESARIVLQSPRGDVTSIIVDAAGQIATQ